MSKPVKDMMIQMYRKLFAQTDQAMLVDIRGIEANELIDGPSAVVHGGESVVNVARELIDLARKINELEIKGAVMDGVVFGPDQIETLSKLPTREEALAEIVQLVISPASQLVSTVTSPGSTVVGIVEEVARKLEAGETIG